MKKTILFCLMLAFTAGAPRLFAQENTGKVADSPPHFYHLLFTVEEVGDSGKIVNSRSYSTTISDHSYNQIRTGTKVPVKSSDKGDIQYIDVGVSVDCRDAHEVNGKFAAAITADISSIAADAETASQPPILRQNRWQANSLIPMGKPTVIFSSDNLQGKGKLQVELTATILE